MTLYLVGIGLNDPEDITLKGLETIKRCDKIYLESYTSKLDCSKEDLEKLYGKEIILADRNQVENRADELLEGNTALLIIGDVFSATTHQDLLQRAKEKNVDVKIINNASVLTAIGITGLSLYKFGKTTSIPFENENVETPYNIIKENNKLHTLILLDLRPELNKYMTINEAIQFLLNLENKKQENIFTKDTLCIACTQLGSKKSVIKAGKAKDLLKESFTQFPQCLIIPGEMHFMEEEALETYK